MIKTWLLQEALLSVDSKTLGIKIAFMKFVFSQYDEDLFIYRFIIIAD